MMQQEREYHEVTGDQPVPSMIMGIDHIRDPRLNKVTKSIILITNVTFDFLRFLGPRIYTRRASGAGHPRFATGPFQDPRGAA
jgi:hypothetical protein